MADHFYSVEVNYYVLRCVYFLIWQAINIPGIISHQKCVLSDISEMEN